MLTTEHVIEMAANSGTNTPALIVMRPVRLDHLQRQAHQAGREDRQRHRARSSTAGTKNRARRVCGESSVFTSYQKPPIPLQLAAITLRRHSGRRVL